MPARTGFVRAIRASGPPESSPFRLLSTGTVSEHRSSVGNGLGGYQYFGEMGARPKQPGFGEVAPTLGRAGFFSGIRLTRGGLGPKITTVG
jgi:hypothetical protein